MESNEELRILLVNVYSNMRMQNQTLNMRDHFKHIERRLEDHIHIREDLNKIKEYFEKKLHSEFNLNDET